METPILTYAQLSDLLVQALRSVVDENCATYVAGPLATGRLYYRELVAGTLIAEEVRQSNELKMRAFVHARRKRGGQPVIDSGVLRVPHWSAREHGDFFLRVIAELCCDVILLDGWEYSSGATKEFIFAQQHGVPCFDASNIELTLERGRLLIEQAMEVVRESGGPFDVFERRLQSISGLSSG